VGGGELIGEGATGPGCAFQGISRRKKKKKKDSCVEFENHYWNSGEGKRSIKKNKDARGGKNSSGGRKTFCFVITRSP